MRAVPLQDGLRPSEASGGSPSDPRLDMGIGGDGQSGDVVVGGTTPEDRKRMGIYYTPSGAARILCEWAIRSESDRVLEPSFGACGFLEAAVDRLREVGADSPLDQLYGCDIDEAAFTKYLDPKLGRGVESGRYLHRDFLSVRPDDFDGGAFDAVVGNPPYVSYHTMDEGQRPAACEDSCPGERSWARGGRRGRVVRPRTSLPERRHGEQKEPRDFRLAGRAEPRPGTLPGGLPAVLRLPRPALLDHRPLRPQGAGSGVAGRRFPDGFPNTRRDGCPSICVVHLAQRGNGRSRRTSPPPYAAPSRAASASRRPRAT